MFDYHVHTSMCGHARGTMEEYVQSAIRKGLSEIGFADHLPLLYTDDVTLSMRPEDLQNYVDAVLDLKDRYRERIDVRLGIEADYYPETLRDVERMLEAHPFDYVIGSVHILGDWIFDDPREAERYEDVDIDELYIAYLEAEKEMVVSGFYDIVGHADLVKKFDRRASIDLTPHYRGLLSAMKKAGVCFEVNTAGLRWPVGEIYPEPDFVMLGSGTGVHVTLGSDAHCPEDVGRDFNQALKLLRDSRYTEAATFKNRVMKLVPLA
jgi:histidinol-phosphatase (PHP family)